MLRKFLSLTGTEKILLAESYFLHLLTGLLLKIIPFNRITKIYGKGRNDEKFSPGSTLHRTRLNACLIREATRRASLFSPWQNKCLVSSLAARVMLRRRKIDSDIFLGVAKDASGQTLSHAWITVGPIEVVPKRDGYSEMLVF